MGCLSSDLIQWSSSSKISDRVSRKQEGMSTQLKLQLGSGRSMMSRWDAGRHRVNEISLTTGNSWKDPYKVIALPVRRVDDNPP
jgi:hypothetical protein